MKTRRWVNELIEKGNAVVGRSLLTWRIRHVAFALCHDLPEGWPVAHAQTVFGESRQLMSLETPDHHIFQCQDDFRERDEENRSEIGGTANDTGDTVLKCLRLAPP